MHFLDVAKTRHRKLRVDIIQNGETLEIQKSVYLQVFIINTTQQCSRELSKYM